VTSQKHTKCPKCRAVDTLRNVVYGLFVAWKCAECGESFTEEMLDDCATSMGRHPLGHRAWNIRLETDKEE